VVGGFGEFDGGGLVTKVYERGRRFREREEYFGCEPK
jgi:hypothetical protein